jgi:MinD superfamily P-loop ATPase
VAAGKGGTGKTLVSTSLAQALCTPFPGQVQLLDCDVEEPNAHLLLRPAIVAEESVTVLVPEVDLGVCTRCGRCAAVCPDNAIAVIRQAVVTFPELCSGCGCCAFVCRAEAIREVPRQVGTVHLGETPEGIEFAAGELNVGDQKATPVTRAVKAHIRADRVTIIDAPPGTACPMQETVAESDFCLLVTEPTPFGLSDLRAAVETCRGLGVPCGILINRWGSGFEGVEAYCEAEGLPVLAKIAQDRAIAEAYSRGEGLLSARPESREELLAIFDEIRRLIAEEVRQSV